MSPILAEHDLEILSRGAAQTRRVGVRLGEMLSSGDLVCLNGDLGSGKTTLVQGIVAGWGSLDPVTSPTYVLVNEYRHPEGGLLFHLDAYRLESPARALDLDLEDLLAAGPLVVEWADRIRTALPEEGFQANLRWVDEDRRQIHFAASGERYQTFLDQFRRRLFAG